MPIDLRSLFLIRPDVAFLNHGSFGACPASIMERYQFWQIEAEREPVEFHGRRAPGLMRAAREALAELVGAVAPDLVYVNNATFGVNIVARSLRFGPDDEVLGTDHEYGACDRIWRFLEGRGGARYRTAVISTPVTTASAVVDELFAQVGPETRAIFISHITSPTAITFPVAEICRRAREAGLLTIVDGAHAPGQIPLDLGAVGADFYVGNLHKWLCAPKGAAFLHARQEVQNLLEPLVVSWGWQPVESGESPFIDQLEYRGTTDISAALTVPDAIAFQRDHDWDAVREECHRMVIESRPLIAQALDAEPLAPAGADWFQQMSAFLLPARFDGKVLQRLLFDEYRVEIPVAAWNDRQTIRISIQGYNTWSDVERLVDGISQICRTGAALRKGAVH